MERAGRIADACEAYRAAIEAEPGHVPGYLNLGVALEALGLGEEANRVYAAALAVEPANPFAAFNLGKMAFTRGDLAGARERIELALRGKPDFADAQIVLASVHEALGDDDASLACLGAALRLEPANLVALRNLGRLQARLGRWVEAEAALRALAGADAGDADAHFWHGRALLALGQPPQAEARLREALRLHPESAEVLTHLGLALCALGRTEEAREVLARAVRLAPGHAEAHAALGSAFAADKMMAQATQSYQHALELDPRQVHSHVNLGNVLAGRGERAEARRHYDAALALDPENVEARWSRAMATIPAIADSREALVSSRDEFAAELSELESWFDPVRAAQGHRVVGLRQPFWLAYQEESNTDLLRAYGRLCARLMSAWPRGAPGALAPPRTGARLRVGVVSQYFRNHSVWNAIVKGWFLHLDPARFELLAFSLGAIEDDETHLARQRAARFEQGPRSLEQWVQAIESARPDVLLYPEIGMDRVTTQLASLRLAPLQAASWGHPETTGLPTMDAYLSAEAMEPPGAQSHYSETLVALPRLGCSVPPEPETMTMPVRLDELGLDGTGPLLVCPGTPFKYAPEHDDVFPRIARELGECRFVFFEYPTRDLSERLRRRLGQAFERAGLAPERHLLMLPWLNRPAFLGLMGRADVFLDTIGFSGFNTALQAVQSGLPMVTVEGRFLRGRLASGILRRIGMDELVAGSDEDYVARVVRISRDARYRDALRARMAASRAALYDDRDAVRGLEGFLLAS
ncbi:MAG: tetratricopeptide repeat protein [Burkholderiales bacterium]